MYNDDLLHKKNISVTKQKFKFCLCYFLPFIEDITRQEDMNFMFEWQQYITCAHCAHLWDIVIVALWLILVHGIDYM